MKLTKKQVELMKSNIDKMAESEEQFIFMLFKNPNGKDNITAFSYNIPPEKLNHYLLKELRRGVVKNETI